MNYLKVNRWVKSSKQADIRAWNKEYRLRIRDVPEFFKCWEEFAKFFETWADDSPVRWRPEFLREIPSEISVVPGCKSPFRRRDGRVLLEVIESNAHIDVRDEWHTYFYVRSVEQDQQNPRRWQLDPRILAVDVEDLHAGLIEFDDWYRQWVKPCATTSDTWQRRAQRPLSIN